MRFRGVWSRWAHLSAALCRKSRMYCAFSAGRAPTGNWHVAILNFSAGLALSRGLSAGSIRGASAAAPGRGKSAAAPTPATVLAAALMACRLASPTASRSSTTPSSTLECHVAFWARGTPSANQESRRFRYIRPTAPDMNLRHPLCGDNGCGHNQGVRGALCRITAARTQRKSHRNMPPANSRKLWLPPAEAPRPSMLNDS